MLIVNCKSYTYRVVLADGKTIAETKDVPLDEVPVSDTEVSDNFIGFDERKDPGILLDDQ